MELISEKHKLELIKKIELSIDSNFNIIIQSNYIPNTISYDVFKLKMYYDINEPLDFLNILLNTICQNIISMKIIMVSKTRYNIHYNNEVIAFFTLGKKSIVLSSDLITQEIKYSIGQDISNFNIFKFLLSCLNIQNFMDKIKSIIYPNYEILYINTPKPYNYNTYKTDLNYHITVYQEDINKNFDVIYNVEFKKFIFNYYLHNEGEIYTNGDEPLTVLEITEEIKYNQMLLDNISEIEKYVEYLNNNI